MNPLRAFLEGRPFRSPVHPALVHLPIGFFTAGCVLDVLGCWPLWADWSLPGMAFAAHAAGVVTALLAAVPGFVDFTEIRRDHPAWPVARRHMVLNLVAVVLFAGVVAWRAAEPAPARTPAGPLALALVAYAVLGYSGYLGGMLVYDDGVGVGRQRRRTRLPRRTRIIRTGEATGAVDLGPGRALPDGGIERVEVDGTVMVLVRRGGAVHAVQEFCTHRFGPLSEGTCENGCIVCPWHRSAFQLADGRVRSGPAQVDLRSFAVTERDGRLWLHRSPART